MSETKRKGDISEAVVLAALVEAGYRVLLPWGDNAPYDLVVDTNGEFIRVQVKTGRLDNGAVKFNPRSVRARGRGETAQSERYDGKADLFMVYCPQTKEIYVIPVLGCPYAPHLRVHPPLNGQQKGIIYAADFIFDGTLSTDR